MKCRLTLYTRIVSTYEVLTDFEMRGGHFGLESADAVHLSEKSSSRAKEVAHSHCCIGNGLP